MKEDYRKGDFVYLTNCDRKDLEIDLSDAEIRDMSKNMWKKYIKETVKSAALKCLVNENNTKEKTKGIKFSSLELSEYLRKNMKKSVSQIIFSTRSKTLEIKQWAPWKFTNDMCVKCGLLPETMNHFMCCKSYKSKPYEEWNDINEDNYEKQLMAGVAIENRFLERINTLEKQEAGRSEDTDSTAPGDCRAMLQL